MTLWSASEDRYYKHLSVRPSLAMSFFFNDNETGWALANRGLGPAIVRRFEVYIDEQQRKDWNAFAQALGAGPKFWFTNPYAESTVAAGTTLVLFSMKTNEGADVLQKNVTRVRMSICFCSLYDECWEASTRPGAIGGRNKSVASCGSPRLGEETWHGNSPI